MTDQIPEPEKDGLTFFPIPDISDVDMAFGLDGNWYFSRGDLPEVPGKWEGMAQELFSCGGRLPEFHPKVDRTKAARLLGAMLTSFAPPHESKIATAGYALWLWCDPSAIDQHIAEGKS